MVNGSPSQYAGQDKGLFHSGMFLRPRVATSLQTIIQNKMIQEQAKFTVAKSQIHPNGLCEMVVKRLDPTVSTGSIMEFLKKCRDLVQDSGIAQQGIDSEMNRTIELSDDDSVCALSPARYGGRKVSFKCGFSPLLSPSFGRQQSLSQNFGVQPLPKIHSPTVTINSIESVSPLADGNTRKVSTKRTASFDTLNITISSSNKPYDTRTEEPEPKRPIIENIVVQVPNNIKPLQSPESADPNSSVVLLEVTEDVLPSAPTWTSAQPSIFPLSNVSKILGAKEKKNVDSERQTFPSWTSAHSSKFPISNVRKILGVEDVQCQTKISTPSHEKDKTQEHMKKSDNEYFKMHFPPSIKLNEDNAFSKPSISDVSVEILDLPEDVPLLSQTPSSSASLEKGQDLIKQPSLQLPESGITELGVTKDVTAASPEKCSPEFLPLTGKECSTYQNLSPNDVQRNNTTGASNSGSHQGSSISDCNKNRNSASGGSSGDNNSSSSDCSDDDIIIEKEFKNDGRTHPLLIDDSDDEIEVCKEIVKGAADYKKEKGMQKSNSKPKGKRKRQSSPFKVSADTSFTASTSNEPAPDFIPLNRHTSNRPNPKYHDRKAKQQKIKEKKLKKANALKHSSVRKGEADTTSHKTSKEENKKKHDYDGNLMNPNPGAPKAGLRPIIIDASNVAIGHGHGRFSVAGLKICIKYFTDRGHKVHAFVPKYRRFQVSPEDRKALDDLEKEGSVCFTPSRTMQDGRKVASYDDRFVVQTAAELGGVVISTDNYRDLLAENESWRETIEQRLLMFTWVGDMLLFPNDPLGRNGPHLQDFLRFPDPPAT